MSNVAERTATTVVAVVVFVCLGLLAGSPIGVADDAEDGPSPIPPEFYGTVSIDGEPAPEGTELVATIDGEKRGSVTIDDNGEYGSPTAFGEKLVVIGDREDENATITFLVDGEEAEQTATWSNDTTTTLDLTLDGSGTGDDDSGSSGGTGSGGWGASGGQNADGDTDDQDGDDGSDGDGIQDGSNGDVDRADDQDDPPRTDPADEDPADVDDTVPGFGVIAGIVAVVVALLYRSARTP